MIPEPALPLESLQSAPVKPKITFTGSGNEFLGIFLTNFLLTVVTLGLYRPWAKVAVRKYVYQNTDMNGSRFIFTGVGSEMFIGYLKAIGIILGLTGIYRLSIYLAMEFSSPIVLIVGFLVFLGGYLLLIPIALFGSLRYRLAHTQWRSIRFAYVGSQRKLINVFLKGAGLTLITVGIYLPWFVVSLTQEVSRNIRFGNVQFRFNGAGSDLFFINFKGYFLTYITLGIYSFWWLAERFNFYVDNTIIYENGQQKKLIGNATGRKMFNLLFLNILLIVLTLGIGYAWAQMRTIRTHLSWIEFRHAIDLDSIEQAPELPSNATSDFLIDLGDIMFG